MTRTNMRGQTMNFTNINYFLAIAEEGSISSAARKLFISQQSLSEQLKKMESEVGTPLFLRGNRRLTLTPAGERFYSSCKEITGLYNSALTDIKDITAHRKNKIPLAVPTSYTPAGLAEFIAIFQKEHPEYELVIVKRQHADIRQNMEGIDLYLSPLPLNASLENHILLPDDPYCAVFDRKLLQSVFPKNHSEICSRLRETGNLSEICELPLILLRNRYSVLSEDLSMILNEYQLTPNVALYSENCDVNDFACVHRLGCLIVPQSYARTRLFQNKNLDTSGLLSFPIRVNSFSTVLAIASPKGKNLHTAEKLFIQEAEAFIKERIPLDLS
jgi:DNA-binding transcriptional LysR family regulator